MSRNILHRDYFARFILNLANIISWLVIGFIIVSLIYIVSLKFRLPSSTVMEPQKMVDPVKSTCSTD